MFIDCRPILKLADRCRSSWKKIEELETEIKQEHTISSMFPDACPVPSSLVGCITAEKLGIDLEKDKDQPAKLAILNAISEQITMWNWEKDRNIYRIATELYVKMLRIAEETAFDDVNEIDVDLLFQLPSPCVYIENPGIVPMFEVSGFFCRIDYSIVLNLPTLKIQLFAPGKADGIFQDTDEDVGVAKKYVSKDTISVDIPIRKKSNGHYVISKDEYDFTNSASFACHALVIILLYIASRNSNIDEEQVSIHNKNWKERISINQYYVH